MGQPTNMIPSHDYIFTSIQSVRGNDEIMSREAAFCVEQDGL